MAKPTPREIVDLTFDAFGARRRRRARRLDDPLAATATRSNPILDSIRKLVDQLSRRP